MIRLVVFIIIITNVIMCPAQNISSQSLKAFTLDELISGGKDHKAVMPQEKDLWWDGETFVDAKEKARPEEYPKVVTRNHNIYLTKTADSPEKQVTTDGTREVVYGESVHRNEFGIEKGIFLSPTKRLFAFYRMDQSMVADYPQVNTFEREATYEPDKYPMSGMTSHEVRVGVYDIEKGRTIYLDMGDVKDRYFTNIAWAPDEKSLYLIELDRSQKHASLDEYSIEDGRKLRTLCEEHDEKYVEPQHPMVFLPWDQRRFIMWSQKSGYWHIYLYDSSKGQQIKDLTQGDYCVLDIVGFRNETKSIIVLTTELSPLQANLFSINIETGEKKLLDNGEGVHHGTLSADGTQLLDRYSTPTIPLAYNIRNMATGKEKHLKVEHRLDEYQQQQFRMGQLTAADGKTTLYYRLVLPAGFDEQKAMEGKTKEKLPVVVYVYNGPHIQLVNASYHWKARPWETYMAQKGYAVFILDGRGSDNRGKAFEQVTYHQLGQYEMLDQMKGVEYLLSLPYIDKERIGLHGWSFGGFMAISLMTNYPDTFKTCVAGGAVVDWKWYEVMYGERYMGKPQENEEGYEKTSLLSKAKDLKGSMLLITGMNDPVVVPQHTMQFINACNEAGTYPDLYVYPGQQHNMKGQMAVHLHEKITRYFDEKLK